MNAKPNNNLAVVSLISGVLGWVALPFVGAIAAIITGHMARREIRRTGEDGDALAMVGLVLGYASLVTFCGAFAVAIALYIGVFGALFATGAFQ